MKPYVAVVLVGLLIVASTGLPAGVESALAKQPALHLRFEGVVNSVADGRWRVRDSTVLVDDQTFFDEAIGRAEVGAWVLVMASVLSNGSVQASKIQTLVPASQVAAGIEFSGPLEAMNGNNTWVAGGEEFVVDDTTRLPPNPVLGVLVKVTATQVGATLHATIVEAVPDEPGSAPVQYTGVINSWSAGVWVIEDSPVVLNGSTEVRGNPPAVGKLADVQALLRSDGTLLAQVIYVQTSPAAQMIGGLVLDVLPGDTGVQTLNLMLFPAQPWADPVTASVQLTARTFVDASRALLSAGQWVDMRVRPKADGTFQVDALGVEQPVRVRLQGVAQAQGLKNAAGKGWWSLDGRPIWTNADDGLAEHLSVDTQTSSGGLQTASGVLQTQVEGLLLGNGVILAGRLQPPNGVAAPAQAITQVGHAASVSWSAPTPIVSSLVYASRPVIVTTPDDIEHAVWESNGYVYYSHSLSDGLWSQPERVVYGSSPAMIGDPSGALHLVYTNYWMGNNEVFYVRWQNGQWGEPRNISNTPNGDSRPPCLARSPDGSLQATWTDVSSGGQPIIYLGNRIGSASIWGSRPVASATGQVPVVAVAPDGLVFIAWQDNTSATSNEDGNYDVWITQYRRVNGRNEWGMPVNLSDNPTATSIGASIVAGADGQARVVWVENSNQIKYAFGRDTHWGTPVKVSQDSSSPHGPRIAFDHGALLNVVWDEGDKILTASPSLIGGLWSTHVVAISQPTANLRDVALNALRTGGFVVGWVQSNGPGQVGIYESSRPTALTESIWLPAVAR